MTEQVLSKDALVQMLRRLADRVEASADVYEVGMESEEIGRATKTTITLWGLQRPSVTQAEIAALRASPWRSLSTEGSSPAQLQWCEAWRDDIAPSRKCRTLLRYDGSCPQAARHR